MTRYPLDALVAVSGVPEAVLARRVGLSGTSLKNAREKGLREDAADRYAVRAGFVPWLVWPEWLEDATQLCPGCGEAFAPSRKGHTYCTERCYHRWYGREAFRRRYAADSDFRESRRARAKAYRKESKKALLVSQRRWKADNAEQQREYRRAYYLANRERLLARQREYDRRKREGRAA